MPDKVAIGPREWRATELIGDYVNLKGGTHYGYVRDLIISKDGELKAVIVSPDVGYGQMGGSLRLSVLSMVMTMAGILVTTITTCPMGRPTSPICSPMHTAKNNRRRRELRRPGQLVDGCMGARAPCPKAGSRHNRLRAHCYSYSR